VTIDSVTLLHPVYWLFGPQVAKLYWPLLLFFRQLAHCIRYDNQLGKLEYTLMQSTHRPLYKQRSVSSTLSLTSSSLLLLLLLSNLRKSSIDWLALWRRNIEQAELWLVGGVGRHVTRTRHGDASCLLATVVVTTALCATTDWWVAVRRSTSASPPSTSTLTPISATSTVSLLDSQSHTHIVPVGYSWVQQT